MPFPLAGRLFPTIRRLLDQDRLAEIHRQASDIVDIDRAEMNRRVTQAAAMCDEESQEVSRIVIGHCVDARFDTFRCSRTGLHKRFRALHRQPEIGNPSPARRQGFESRILGEDCFDLVETQVRAASNAALDDLVALFDGKGFACSFPERLRENRAGLPGAQELRNLDGGIELESLVTA